MNSNDHARLQFTLNQYRTTVIGYLDDVVIYNTVCQVKQDGSNYTSGGPVSENLTTANISYSYASGEMGATITGFGQRVCWEGGTCDTGDCQLLPNGTTNPSTRQPNVAFKCPENGGNSIYYVIKELGDACDPDDDDMGMGM